MFCVLVCVSDASVSEYLTGVGWAGWLGMGYVCECVCVCFLCGMANGMPVETSFNIRLLHIVAAFSTRGSI